MAETGEFTFGSSPTMRGNMSATCRRDGGTVIVDWSAAVRLEYSGSVFGTGYTMQINASGSSGGSSSAMIHNSTDSWRDTSWHYCSGSFSYANASAHNFTVTFSSTTNTSSSGKFSGKSVSLSIGSFNPDYTIFIGCNSDAYMEFMCKTPYTFPTWSDADGQNDIVWVSVGSGSWNRGGIDYGYAAGHTHTNASLDDSWHTHVYVGTTGYGGFYYYPRLYIKYNANGGSSTPATQTKYLGSEISLAGAISRSHYSFQGWSTSSTATSASYSAGRQLGCEAWNSISGAMSSNNGWTDYTPSHSGNNVTLYAVWKANTYTVSYNANGGSSTPTKNEVQYPNSVTLADAISRSDSKTTTNIPISVDYNANGGSNAPTGSVGTAVDTTTYSYSFDKWHLNSATGTAYSAKASYQPTANVTMYAGWNSLSSISRTSNPSITLTSGKPTKASVPITSYAVSYNANGGSSTPATQNAVKATNYAFSKWNSKADGTGTNYNSSTAYTFSANTTLYAQYTSSVSGGSITLPDAIKRNNGSTTGYTVTYNANGGSGAPSNQTSGNRAITYTFDKWAAGSATGTKYAAGATFTPSAATTMYATWTSSTSANSSWTCSNVKPQKTGCKFKGWATSATATTPNYEAGKTYNITGNITVYAVWEDKFSIGGGEGTLVMIDDHIQGMKLKILEDGSQWARIFWHDISTTATYFASKDEAKNCSETNRFSKLENIADFLYNGKYEFMLCYPRHSTTKYNRWVQTANLLTTTANANQTASTMGYKPIHIDFKSNWGYGIGLSTSVESFLDCQAGYATWFGAVGQLRAAYTANNITGFPAPTESGMEQAQKEVELWVRVYIKARFAKNSESNKIYINTRDEFASFCDSVSNGNTYEGKTVYLNTNVWFSPSDQHVEFFPAGDATHKFLGTFDGRGHTLTLHYIDDDSASCNYMGFIAYNEGVIRNLRVNNMYWNYSNYAGLICGYNAGLIEGCSAGGMLTSNSSTTSNVFYVGGIAGYNSGVIRKCISDVTINGTESDSSYNVGGIAGKNQGEITSCRNEGEITGGCAGGITGYSITVDSNITRCVNVGAIGGIYSGGIVGYGYRGYAQDCLNTGNGASAGIVGMAFNFTTNNCYYASNYNSSGMVFGDTGKTDNTIKKTLAEIQTNNMIQLLGANFFYLDGVNILFNWEKVSSF